MLSITSRRRPSLKFGTHSTSCEVRHQVNALFPELKNWKYRMVYDIMALRLSLVSLMGESALTEASLTPRRRLPSLEITPGASVPILHTRHWANIERGSILITSNHNPAVLTALSASDSDTPIATTLSNGSRCHDARSSRVSSDNSTLILPFSTPITLTATGKSSTSPFSSRISRHDFDTPSVSWALMR